VSELTDPEVVSEVKPDTDAIEQGMRLLMNQTKESNSSASTTSFG
jgi:hypothetical protein